MASFDSLMAMEPWAFRSTFADSWFPDVFTRETETLTKVSPSLQQEPAQTPTCSAQTLSGGSEIEATTGSNRRSKAGVSGKITKRKSRVSRRNTTTYITADVDNFRHMVQQVTGLTGFRFNDDGQVLVPPLLKPEPHRGFNRLQPGNCFLPTLDTSAFLLDLVTQQPQQLVDTTRTILHSQPPAELTTTANVAVDGGSRGFDFGSFSGFPTLESFQ